MQLWNEIEFSTISQESPGKRFKISLMCIIIKYAKKEKKLLCNLRFFLRCFIFMLCWQLLNFIFCMKINFKLNFGSKFGVVSKLFFLKHTAFLTFLIESTKTIVVSLEKCENCEYDKEISRLSH